MVFENQERLQAIQKLADVGRDLVTTAGTIALTPSPAIILAQVQKGITDLTALRDSIQAESQD